MSRRPRLECRNFLVDLVVPGNVGNQVFNYRESFHWIHDDGLIQRQRIHARLAHQARPSVHFRGARAALGGLAIPAHGQIGRLVRLNGMDGVQDDHARRERHLVIDRLAAIFVAAKNS